MRPSTQVEVPIPSSFPQSCHVGDRLTESSPLACPTVICYTVRFQCFNNGCLQSTWQLTLHLSQAFNSSVLSLSFLRLLGGGVPWRNVWALPSVKVSKMEQSRRCLSRAQCRTLINGCLSSWDHLPCPLPPPHHVPSLQVLPLLGFIWSPFGPFQDGGPTPVYATAQRIAKISL